MMKMKRTLKRALALIVAVILIVVMMAACASTNGGTNNPPNNDDDRRDDRDDRDDRDESRDREEPEEQVDSGDPAQIAVLNGFLDAAVHMFDETNLRSEGRIILSFSDSAEPASIVRLINAIFMGMPPENIILGAELGLMVTTEAYEDTAAFTISWIGDGGRPEPIISMIFVDDILYVGLEFIDIVRQIDGLTQMFPDLAQILPLFNFDYIAVDIDEILEMLGIDMDDLMDEIFWQFEDIGGLEDLEALNEALEAIVYSVAGTLADALRSFAPQMLTSDILKKDGDVYTLTLNAVSAVRLAESAVNAAAENEEAIKLFLRDLIMEVAQHLKLDGRTVRDILEELDYIDFARMAREFNYEIDYIMEMLESGEIPHMELELSLSGTGQGADKRQTASAVFSVTDLYALGMPFNTVAYEVSGVTTVMRTPIAAPSGNVVSFVDLIPLFEMLAEEMGGMFGSSGASDSPSVPAY